MSTRKSKVVFDEVQIFEFNQTLGDNPGVSAGAPIALGHKLKTSFSLDVDVYETTRGKRKSRKKLTIPVQERAQLLLNLGYSLQDIANATLEAHNISMERAKNCKETNWEKVSDVSERFTRLFTKKKTVPRKSTVVAISA